MIGCFVDKVVLRNIEQSPGIDYYAATIVIDIGLSVVAAVIVAWFSSHREYRADRGAADLMGHTPIEARIAALQQQRSNGCTPVSPRRAPAMASQRLLGAGRPARTPASAAIASCCVRVDTRR